VALYRFQPRGIVALVFSCIAGIVGTLVVAWYGLAPIPETETGTAGSPFFADSGASNNSKSANIGEGKRTNDITADTTADTPDTVTAVKP
jgi:hypothetical protein